MSNHTFMLAFTVGAGLLALWVHARFPALAPERLPRAMLHALLGTLWMLKQAQTALGMGR